MLRKGAPQKPEDNYESERGFNKLNQTQQNLTMLSSASDNDLCSNLSNMSGANSTQPLSMLLRRTSQEAEQPRAPPQQREGLIGKQLWRRECM